VEAADAQRTVEALRKEFAQDLAHEKVEHINGLPAATQTTHVHEDEKKKICELRHP